MANRIYVLCRSAMPITFREIAEQIQDMGFLDKPVRFEPAPTAANEDAPDWGAFELHREDIKPITVEQLHEREELRTLLGELREKVEREDESDVTTSLLQRFEQVQHGLAIHLPEELPEDVWEMLDACEGYFAEIRDGVIVAHEGVFDADLNLLLSWRDPGV